MVETQHPNVLNKGGNRNTDGSKKERTYINKTGNIKPMSLKYNACLKEVNVSLPFTVASSTTQTTTPPCLVILHNSFATFSKSKE